MTFGRIQYGCLITQNRLVGITGFVYFHICILTELLIKNALVFINHKKTVFLNKVLWSLVKLSRQDKKGVIHKLCVFYNIVVV